MRINLYVRERDRELVGLLELQLIGERKSISKFFIEAAEQYLKYPLKKKIKNGAKK